MGDIFGLKQLMISRNPCKKIVIHTYLLLYVAYHTYRPPPALFPLVIFFPTIFSSLPTVAAVQICHRPITSSLQHSRERDRSVQRDRRQTEWRSAYLQNMYKSAIRSHLDWNSLLADPLHSFLPRMLVYMPQCMFGVWMLLLWSPGAERLLSISIAGLLTSSIALSPAAAAVLLI